MTVAFADHFTLQTICFVVAVALVQRATGLRRRGLRLLLALTAAHVACVVVCGVAIPGIDLSNEAGLLARLLAAWVLVLGVGTVVFEVALPRLRVSLSRIIEDLAVFGALGLVSLVVLRRGGVDVTGIVATSAVVTAVIGLSLQDTLGNTIGGLTLQLDDSIHAGDWIKVGDVVGRVKEVRWRFTAVETRNWETVFIPNSKIVKDNVVVLGKRAGQPRQWRRWVYFNVDFRRAPSTVIATVVEALRESPIANVAADPLPNCVLLDLGESTARYAVRYWLTDLAVDDPTDSAVRTRIYFALQRADISLSLPAHAVFVTNETEARRDRKLDADHQRRLHQLGAVEVFAPLDDDERDHLARSLIFAPFAAGERITTQGAAANWLYLVCAGRVSVRVEVNGAEQEVAVLGAGEVFGEMSLLTGEHRAASVYAVTDVETWRLTREAFQSVLSARPEVALPIASLLAERRVRLHAVRDNLDAEASKRRLHEEQADLLSKMRAFFRL